MKLSFAPKISSQKLAIFSRRLAEHAFLFFLMLVLVSFLFSLAIFYVSIWSSQKALPDLTQSHTAFSKELFEKAWQLKEKRALRFEEALILKPRNIFEGVIPAPSSGVSR
ncbi:MAG: hypothetical protein HYV77_03640 [Candidatus Wildermuthbacteria bacterium]|nr:hypothetical protein [Candidatus Wildermuthbacteria bacterium]